jgi:hypothetical protein
VYKSYFQGSDREELARLLSWQLDTKCRAYLDDGIVKFRMNIRASGDMNTGLGTCVIACSLVHSYCTRVGLRYRLINNGDDCVAICERSDLAKFDDFHSFCRSAGYHMVIEPPVDRIEEIEFCQQHPVKTVRGWVMVRNFPVSIGKDFVSVLPLTTPERWAKWANDVGICGLALTSGVPVLQEVYASLARSGRGSFGAHPWISSSGMVRNSRGLEAKCLPITDEARISFCQAFGISPSAQEILEAEYRNRVFNFELGLQGYNITFTDTPTHTLTNPLFD